MITQLKDALDRSRGTFLPDLAGALALGVMLVAALHLPSLA